MCKGKEVGYHATEEAAAQAYENYVTDGVIPVKHPRNISSEFKGVTWYERYGKWQATFKGKYLGQHASKEAAARAYNIEAERIGCVYLNVIPPAGSTDDGSNTAVPAAPAALAMPSLPAPQHNGADYSMPLPTDSLEVEDLEPSIAVTEDRYTVHKQSGAAGAAELDACGAKRCASDDRAGGVLRTST